MSIPFFNSVLSMLGKRVNYDAVVNYAGNSFAKDSWKLIQEANPMSKPKKHNSEFIGMISKAPTVKISDPNLFESLSSNPFGVNSGGDDFVE